MDDKSLERLSVLFPRLGSRRRSLVLPRGDVEHRLLGSLATSSRLLTSTTEQRMHSKRLEALSDVPSSSVRLDSVNRSRLLCSNSTVELRSSLENDFPARNSRADANCTEISCARIFGGSSGHQPTKYYCSVDQAIT